jgi:Ala-tRNA(Pro) deacylase
MSLVEKYLISQGISYVLHEHLPVFTCEDADRHIGHIPGIACKNLFLTNKGKRRFFLVILPAYKRAELNEIALKVGEKKLSFASPSLLMEELDLEP